VGVFITYLINKLYNNKNIHIFDPLVGTGNLIAIIANSLESDVSLTGIDYDLNSYKLTSALFDMLGYGDQVYCQDTVSFKGNLADLIVSDFSGIDKDDVYEIIKHHECNIVEGGFLIGIFDEEVVSEEVLIEKAKGLNNLWKLFGLIKLPKGILKNQNKSILVLQRNGENVIQPNRFLLVDLPDFKAESELKIVINQMNDWFKNTEFSKLGEK
jgi:hypothetical protein